MLHPGLILESIGRAIQHCPKSRGHPRQVVGMLARRVVCRVRVGQHMHAGQRFGIMKFGSRMDVFLPPTATIRVRVDEMVRGGETVIAVLD